MQIIEKFATAAEAIAANPNHPLAIHGAFCLSQAAYPERIERIEGHILSYFNRKAKQLPA